jgi:hypothetical protein
MIENYVFGKIVVAETIYTSDIKIVQGEVVSDWWRRRGHLVEKNDVEDIMAAKPDVLVIGIGEPGLMKISSPLWELIFNSSIKLIEEKTPRAIDIFNRLSEEGENVAAGFHISC